MMNSDFLEILKYVALAPSGHNTQPWRFCLTGEEIDIIPCFDVSLPVVDSDNRELYISLGCATENLLIAAGHFGYHARVVRCDATGIKIELTRDVKAVGDILFHQIENRQTNRSVYSGAKIGPEQLTRLRSVGQEGNIRIYFIETGSPLGGTVADYIARGNDIQMSAPDFREELLSWMRFNDRQVKVSCDGLSYKVFENPPLPGWMAKPIVRQFLNPSAQNRSDMKKICSSSHFVLFTTRHNTVDEWIDLGRILQRFGLTAAGAGIACAYCNQPCEVLTLADEMRKSLPVDGGYPTLILRIGYAEPVPCSPRKKVKELLVE